MGFPSVKVMQRKYHCPPVQPSCDELRIGTTGRQLRRTAENWHEVITPTAYSPRGMTGPPKAPDFLDLGPAEVRLAQPAAYDRWQAQQAAKASKALSGIKASKLQAARAGRSGLSRRSIQTRLDQIEVPAGCPAMDTVNIYDAKTRLSQLVDKAAAGEDVVVSRHGKPLVRITRLDAPRRHVTFGLLKGRFKVPKNFDAPLPDETLAAFEGR
jgi:prevent-host-death family protein